MHEINVNTLSEIQKWYSSNCDGNWEHSFGIKVDTLDNPGWSVEIDLNETDLQSEIFEEIDNDISENDWIRCWVKENKFYGVGDENKLEEILQIFLNWADLKSKTGIKDK